MGLVSVILLYTSFTLMFAFYTKHQLADDRGESFGKWHPWRAAMAAYAGIVPMITALFPPAWQDVLIAGVLQWPLFDMAINVIALIKVKLLYIGDTAGTDRRLGKKKWVIYLVAVVVTILIKIFVHFTNNDIIQWVHSI